MGEANGGGKDSTRKEVFQRDDCVAKENGQGKEAIGRWRVLVNTEEKFDSKGYFVYHKPKVPRNFFIFMIIRICK